jgi:hypothetical protein
MVECGIDFIEDGSQCILIAESVRIMELKTYVIQAILSDGLVLIK